MTSESKQEHAGYSPRCHHPENNVVGNLELFLWVDEHDKQGDGDLGQGVCNDHEQRRSEVFLKKISMVLVSTGS